MCPSTALNTYEPSIPEDSMTANEFKCVDHETQYNQEAEKCRMSPKLKYPSSIRNNKLLRPISECSS